MIWGLTPQMFGALMGLIGLIFQSKILIFLGVLIFLIPILLTLSIPTPLWIAIIFIGLYLLIKKK